MAKTKKTTKKTSKENKIFEESTNGQIETDEIDKIKKLEKLLNIENANPFGTNDPKIFEEKMAESTISDLQTLCMRVGIYPTHSKVEMQKKLQKEFQRVTLGQRSVSMKNGTGISDPSHPNHEKAKKMMKEGF